MAKEKKTPLWKSLLALLVGAFTFRFVRDRFRQSPSEDAGGEEPAEIELKEQPQDGVGGTASKDIDPSPAPEVDQQASPGELARDTTLAGEDSASHYSYPLEMHHTGEILSTPAGIDAQRAPDGDPIVQPAAEEVAGPAPIGEEPKAAGGLDALEADDLKLIEGIGPKIAALLAGAGITTFRQLAETSQERLLSILQAANLRLADPSSWPEQAALAASGDVEALTALQNHLKGGRRAA